MSAIAIVDMIVVPNMSIKIICVLLLLYNLREAGMAPRYQTQISN